MVRILQRVGFGLCAVGVFAGCAILAPHREVDINSMSKTVARFNQGAALLEQYSYDKAAEAFEEVVKAAPDWTAARFNLGLAYFNMQESSNAETYLSYAEKTFKAVLQSDPNHLHARFCLGLYYQHLGKKEDALEYFEAVRRADEADPYVAYKYAEVLMSLGREDEGVKVLESVIELDPGFVSAVYRLALQYQRMRQREKAKSLFDRFSDLKTTELTGGSFSVLQAYGTIGKYFTALGADDLPLKCVYPETRLLFRPEVRYFDEKVDKWACPGGSVGLAGIAGGDVDGDGDIDLCISSVGEEGKTSLWINDGSGRFSVGSTLGEKGISPCFGDVDNDGDLDLWLGCAGGDAYFENDGKGSFKKVNAVGSEEAVTLCARLVDFDSDGDLDFAAFRFAGGSVPGEGRFEPAVSSLYNNNRDGTYTDIAEKIGLRLEQTTAAAVVYDDFDNDRDLDFVIFPADGEAICWGNDRAWQYHLVDAEMTGLRTKNVVGATSGDPDEDGDRDLLVFTGDRIHLFFNQGRFRFEIDQGFADSWGELGGTGGQFVDIDNDGDLDIVIADSHRAGGSRGPAVLINERREERFIDATKIDPGNLLGAITFAGNASCIATDFTGNGCCDILLAPTGERPFLIENATPNNRWIEIDLVGTRPQDKQSRSNNSGIGARVEIKTGAISQQYVVGTPSGPVAMPPYRIHAGLGRHRKIDWLRIMWPDAVLQAELELAADQVITITELQRKTSSCPHLFAWNGLHFEFISDFGGMGGLGYLVGPGEYAKPDSTEYVPVPGIEPRDHEYVLQVVEPMEETVYFDEAKLIAVDHPVGTEVYANEMMAVNIEPPDFELFCFKDTIEVVSAVDHRGVDVTGEISALDRRYAGATKSDRRFTGLAEEHFVQLDFGNRLADVSPDARLVLFLSGWVEYGYSSTNFAASQAGLRLQAPSISVFREGKWVELYHEVGYPAGIRHVMTLDVTGKVLPGDRLIRISSNMEVYWDRIFAASILKDIGLGIRELSAKSADLHFLGYPREYSPDGRHPTLYDYDSVDGAIAWKMMPGEYTRYGDVTELIEEADDCYVIMGRGEELTLRFASDSFGPIPDGCVRSFILKTDSFCKDMDLYSAYGDTVEPLPFHSMSNYPYGPDENYPNDLKRREYRQEYNTRRVGEGDE
ncbi:MAG: VCBS repeat-containing protein [Sedimentisphaerales bacterium]|nr:VCBS repeat-containing protein [Sedimentisphaerales bacterium]